jgi:hypothetical protein
MLMRRSVALAAVMTLLAAGPLPVSACALMVNLLADCQPQPECHTVPATKPDSTLDTPTGHDCCALSGSPRLPAKDPPPAPAGPVSLVAQTREQPCLADIAVFNPFSSVVPILPSNPQARLCVFLI